MNKLTNKQKEIITKIKNGSTLHQDVTGWYLRNIFDETTAIHPNISKSLLKHGIIQKLVTTYTLSDWNYNETTKY